MTPDPAELTLRVVADHAPTRPGSAFGLQDKSGDLVAGIAGQRGRLTFECDVRVRRSAAGGNPNFLGSFTHGPANNRHLYLSLRSASEGSTWIRRIKLPLAPITWQLIEAAGGGALETVVDGRAAATVPVSWQVVS